MLEADKKTAAPELTQSTKITSVFTVEPESVKKYGPKHPLQIQYTNDLVDIVAEGVLLLSFVELDSVKRAYSRMVPEYQVRLLYFCMYMYIWFSG